MRWLFLSFALLAAIPAVAQTNTPTAMTPAPDDRAKQWLNLIDDRNYAEAYRQMGAPARDRISPEKWSKTVETARTPLGAMSSRALKDVKLTKTLPGMRDGQYATIRYDSVFAHKAAAVESVTLVSESGAWSVVGYFIN